MTPMKTKNKIFVPGQGEAKKVISDQSRCCGGLLLDWVPFTCKLGIFQVFAIGAQCASGMHVSEKS